MRFLPVSDAFDCSCYSHLKSMERIPDALGDVAPRQFRAPHKHISAAIISRYDERLRNQQTGAPIKDDRFEKYSRVVDVKHCTGCDARSKFLPDPGRDVQFYGRAQPVPSQRNPHHTQRDVVGLVNHE
jgi:hypothetical protein